MADKIRKYAPDAITFFVQIIGAYIYHMSKTVRGWRSTLLWSIIAAAFVGPGTVTTATRAGSEGSYAYIWPLMIALVAGYLLMEMAARITVVTGQQLGKVVDASFGRGLSVALFGAVVLGCTAYQAGNLLGGFGGVELFVDISRYWIAGVGGLIFLLLWFGDVQSLGKILAVVVLAMGLAFLYTGINVGFREVPDTIRATRSVNIDTILALIGTTIVPYNFFLAAGLGKDQEMGDMRQGLLVSFGVGGLITIGILLTGHYLLSFQDFGDLAEVLREALGPSGEILLGVGLFAAGFSSAITAPLAAAIAGKTLLQRPAEDWGPKGKWYRLTWGIVLGAGLVVALSGFTIIPVIIAAQLVNGLLVPLLAALVLYLGNDASVLGEHLNRWWQNILGVVIFGYIAFQGIRKIAGVMGYEQNDWVIAGVGGTFAVVSLVLAIWWARLQHSR